MPDGFSFRLLGIDAFKTAIDGMVTRAEAATHGAVAEAAHTIQASAMQEAPVVTGTLRRSIRVDGPDRESFGVYTASVGPTEVYGRRVELGFQGSDSWGRVFHQQGHPYFEPGVRDVMDRLGEIHARNWAAALRG